MVSNRLYYFAACAAAALFVPGNSFAGGNDYSPSMNGVTGLNNVPSARMDKFGSVKAGFSSHDSDATTFLGMQIASPLYIQIRQTKDGNDFHPGLDFKLRLLRENREMPEISLGMQSAFGNARMAGEYLIASKRYNDFDFTGGIGWGRFGGDARTGIESGPKDWLGGDFGAMAGLEYFTPLDGLSLKLDWAADDLAAGISWQPADWINLGLALQDSDTVMGRISLQGNILDWRGRNTKPPQTNRTDFVKLSSAYSTPAQIGAALPGQRANTKTIEVIPENYGLRGPSLRLINKGSADEIWRNAEFTESASEKSPAGIDFSFRDFKFILDNQIALKRSDDGADYRTSLVAGSRGPDFFGILNTGYSFRLNITDNLDSAPGPVRGNTGEFAENIIAIDTLYGAFTHSFRSDLHVSLIGGYLEETFGGAGGEILWRPYDSRFALGAEVWQVKKRGPDSFLNTGFEDDNAFTGHLNAWYDIPGWDMTLQGRFGRYLARDTGGTIALLKNFHSGIGIESYVTVTDRDDTDLFGGNSNTTQGIRINVPLGGFSFMPQGASIRTRAETFTRDSGQALSNPLPLYDLTTPLSKGHMAEYWDEINN